MRAVKCDGSNLSWTFEVMLSKFKTGTVSYHNEQFSPKPMRWAKNPHASSVTSKCDTPARFNEWEKLVSAYTRHLTARACETKKLPDRRPRHILNRVDALTRGSSTVMPECIFPSAEQSL